MESKIEFTVEFIEWIERKESIARIKLFDKQNKEYEASCVWSNGEAENISDISQINTEKETIKDINRMCEQSLPPDDFDRWEQVLNRLKKNRPALRQICYSDGKTICDCPGLCREK